MEWTFVKLGLGLNWQCSCYENSNACCALLSGDFVYNTCLGNSEAFLTLLLLVCNGRDLVERNYSVCGGQCLLGGVLLRAAMR